MGEGPCHQADEEEGQTAQETADKSPQTAGLHVAAKDCG